jgi:YVTN family beta-propeller protein
VSVMDARTGRTLRTVRVGRRPWAIAVASAHGRGCVANAADNTVSVLDARSGRVLRTVPVGLSPTAMAVDVPMARVYVANKLADHGPRL